MANIRRAVAVVALLAALGAPAAASAASGGSSIGAKVGLNWSRLTRPDDPLGSPTLMHGTAFGGFGFTAGPSYRLNFASDGPPTFGLGADVLYSFHRATGFEVDRGNETRRTAILSAHVVRAPLLATVQVGSIEDGFAGYLGLGPELWAGLQTSATVELEGAPGPPEPLNTTSVTHGTLHAVLGTSFPAGPNLAMPIEIRTAWDPFVRNTTVDRFAGFSSAENPGFYQVAFDWQILLMTGISWTGL